MNYKLYKASNFSYTPFENFGKGDLDYLERNNITIVNKACEADIIISQNYKHLKKHFWRVFFKKKYLIWTTEPRFNTNFITSRDVVFGLIKCHIMNVYTEDVFVSNITFTTAIISEDLTSLESSFKIQSRKIVALMSYYGGVNAPQLIRNKENIDLITLRSKIAMEGSQRNVIDVFGKGWPEGISMEDSRDGDWGNRKKTILADYNFNLCFENTATFNYMTEKIWDSIGNYCLPIYYGKNTNAYEIFPKDSFIDYSDFNSPQELFLFIENMMDETYVKRMNKCIEVYNNISEKDLDITLKERKKMLDKIIEKVKLIYSN
jgi:hypothetical protein